MGKLARLGTMVLVIAAGAALSAHHSFSAEYDSTKPVRLQGHVVRVEWINPHTWIHLEVKDADGKARVWMIEGGAPNAMLRRGFTKTSLPVGTEIVVEGFRAVDGSLNANG